MKRVFNNEFNRNITICIWIRKCTLIALNCTTSNSMLWRFIIASYNSDLVYYILILLFVNTCSTTLLLYCFQFSPSMNLLNVSSLLRGRLVNFALHSSQFFFCFSRWSIGTSTISVWRDMKNFWFIHIKLFSIRGICTSLKHSH